MTLLVRLPQWKQKKNKQTEQMKWQTNTTEREVDDFFAVRFCDSAKSNAILSTVVFSSFSIYSEGILRANSKCTKICQTEIIYHHNAMKMPSDSFLIAHTHAHAICKVPVLFGQSAFRKKKFIDLWMHPQMVFIQPFSPRPKFYLRDAQSNFTHCQEKLHFHREHRSLILSRFPIRFYRSLL